MFEGWNAQELEQRLSDAYDRATQPCGGKVVIFGSGQLGRYVLPHLRAAGLDAVAYCDNNSAKWGAEIDGVPVLSPIAALEQFANQAFFLIAIYNPSSVVNQLREMGCRHIVRYPLLYCRYSQFIPDVSLALPHTILEHADEIRAAYDLLCDDESRREFSAQIQWRGTLDDDALPKPRPSSEIYFPQDLFRMTSHEVLVDCGAFDGDSIQQFLARTGGEFAHIHAFEPDVANRDALNKTLDAHGVRARATIHPYAVGARDETLRFSSKAAVNSKLDAEGDLIVECRRIDAVLGNDVHPTLIKMDIEGAEIDAIEGACDTIARSRPVMAVCAYHQPDHLWTLPRILKAANPDYQIFLRRYAEQCWETVYYAVPKHHDISPLPERPLMK